MKRRCGSYNLEPTPNNGNNHFSYYFVLLQNRKSTLHIAVVKRSIIKGMEIL
jgi:hypothetical protein